MYLGDSFDKRNMEQYMREVSSRSDGLVRDEGFGSAILHRARCAETWHSRPRRKPFALVELGPKTYRVPRNADNLLLDVRRRR